MAGGVVQIVAVLLTIPEATVFSQIVHLAAVYPDNTGKGVITVRRFLFRNRTDKWLRTGHRR